jgi:hypothetical protein
MAGKITIQAPNNPILPDYLNGDIGNVEKYLRTDLFNYSTDTYKFLYFMWERTGSYNSIIPVTLYNMGTKGSSGISDNNLLEYKLLANSLANDNNYVSIHGFGSFATNANSKRLRLFFGSSVLLDTSYLPLNSGTWDIQAQVIRVDSGSQKAIVTAVSSNASLTAKSFYVKTNEDLSNDVVIKFVANANAQNDIVQEGLIIQIN